MNEISQTITMEGGWMDWCRLCAKTEEDRTRNISLYEPETADHKDKGTRVLNSMLVSAIGKYFWVNIMPTDRLPHRLCRECHGIVTGLMEFSQHVNKVQSMYYALMTANVCAIDDKSHEIRNSYDIDDNVCRYVLRKQNNKTEWLLDNDNNDDDNDKEQQQTYDMNQNENEEEEINIKLENNNDNDNQEEEEEENMKDVKIVRRSSRHVDRAASQEVIREIMPTTTSNYKYKCQICNRQYKNPTSYKSHMLSCHETSANLPDFKCGECGKIYTTAKQLESHERSHLPLELKMDVPCPYCGKKFTKVSILRQHISGQHYQEKPFICDECGKALKTLAALKEHKLVHTSECPFECEICHKRFKNRSRLKTHSDVHEESTYNCDVCNMRLNTRRTLKMHMLVHSEHKSYTCNLCPRAFKRGKALKNHLILHTGMRPYKCTFCEKSFSNGSNCRAHKRKMHASELADEEAAGNKLTQQTIVPRLEELRSSENVQMPRTKIRLMKATNDKIKEQTTAAAPQDNAEARSFNYGAHDIFITTEDDEDDDDEDDVENYEDEDDDGQDKTTTMVYEIVEELCN